MRATGRYTWRRLSAASVSRLDGSAHCRSSTPIINGPDSASSSARSAKASTARNRSPGSLVTVIRPRAWSPPAASSPAIAARRGSGDERAHSNARATRPNGLVCSSSSARPSATCMPRPRASASASASSRVLPIPASPSISTTAGWPDAARSRASLRTAISAARPRMRSAGATVLTTGCYWPPPGSAAASVSRGRLYPARKAGIRRPGHLIQRLQQPQPAGEPDLTGRRRPLSLPGARHDPKTATRRLDLVQNYADLHQPHAASPGPQLHRPAGRCPRRHRRPTLIAHWPTARNSRRPARPEGGRL